MTADSAAPPALPFWERPDTVAQFAAREPDVRLVALAARFGCPARTEVLDLGAAAGRNTVYLAARGFAVRAVDASEAMVVATRSRLAALLGPEKAADRVRRAPMDRLPDLGAGSVDLIVALGIYHAAKDEAEWDRALAESHRVLAKGGLVLVANFTDASVPDGGSLVPVSGEPHVFEGLAPGRTFLVGASILDQEMKKRGLEPLIPTETVSRETEGGGRRVTANGLYVKR